MRKPVLIFYALLFVLFIAAPVVPAPVPGFPDYSKWQMASPQDVEVTLKGNKVMLSFDVFGNTDMVKLKKSTLVIIYNESVRYWLAFLTEEIGEKDSAGQIYTKESRYYSFEYVRGRWVFVRDFSSSGDPRSDLLAFLEQKYSLKLN